MEYPQEVGGATHSLNMMKLEQKMFIVAGLKYTYEKQGIHKKINRVYNIGNYNFNFLSYLLTRLCYDPVQ